MEGEKEGEREEGEGRGFHLVTKIWGESAINEWVYVARKFLGTSF